MAIVAAIGSMLGLAVLAGIVFLLVCRSENRPDRVLGLLYHRLLSDSQYERIEPRTEKIFAIPESRFRAQLDYLKQNHYCPVGPDQVLDYIQEGTPLPTRSVLITFDDGCESVYTRALPILKEYGYPALLFVTTDPGSWVFNYGNIPQRRVTEDEMRELDRNGVMIGSHAMSHNALEAMTENEIARELVESQKYLERVLGKTVSYFGVPLNWYGKKVRDAAVAAGYRAVFTSDNGTIHGNSDPFHLRRFIIEGSFGVREFGHNLSARSIVQRRIINSLKRFPARVLGPRIWMPLREHLFASPLGHFFSLRVLKRFVLAGAFGLFVLFGLAVYLIIK